MASVTLGGTALIALGATPQERGTQLEDLTAALLSHFGYAHVTEQEISTGGAEIDVVAERRTLGIGENRVERVICECKAHEVPAGITDWMKFIGKVYDEMLRFPNRSIAPKGYFIRCQA